MSFAQFFVACCLAIVLATVANTQAAATQGPPLCQSGIIEEMPQHIRKVCMALENSDQLTSALKSYINNEASALVANSDDLLKNYNKRTDVDHVFLRFGKRR
ncbi:dromyosuppressin [Drosophila guanche]|uniref:Blast:Dromyosuppressin n=1 Tax=Drosophila guanche TaxID=7266 RepID=A0A3B0KHX2_DROGU|nr:dromyosuppressin [Drosophila guanche]SPP83308.1 blast:Dromyosuppressin [Drosophila guanche]